MKLLGFLCIVSSMFPFRSYSHFQEALTFTLPDKMHIAPRKALISEEKPNSIKLYKSVNHEWLQTPSLKLGSNTALNLNFFYNQGIPTFAVGTAEGRIMIWQWNLREWQLTNSWQAHNHAITALSHKTYRKSTVLITTATNTVTERNETKTWHCKNHQWQAMS